MSKTNIIVDFAMFAATVFLAVWLGWDAKDLIWGLWISSLTLGYSFILAAALSMFFRDKIPKTDKSGDEKSSRKGLESAPPLAFNLIVVVLAIFVLGWGNSLTWLVLLLSGIFFALSLLLQSDDAGLLQKTLWRFVTYAPMAAFIIAFFSIHFGGFHFVHGLFVNQFFPLVKGSLFGNGAEDVFLGMGNVALTALERYWPFVIFSAVSRADDYRKAFFAEGGPNMMMPYANVIRMHLLIFVFAGLHMAQLHTYAVYPILLFYFFPFKELFRFFGFGKN